MQDLTVKGCDAGGGVEPLLQEGTEFQRTELLC